MRWVTEGPDIYAQSYFGGVKTTHTSFAYTSAHKWWRIREATGTIYWDASPNGFDWTNYASYVYAIDVSVVKVMIRGLAYKAETNPGTFIIDNYNINVSSASASLSPSASVSPSASASLSLSPSSSISLSPSPAIQGRQDDIIAVYQANDLRITTAQDSDIIAIEQKDDLIMKPALSDSINIRPQ